MSRKDRSGARSILSVGCDLDKAVEKQKGDLVAAVGKNPGLIVQMAALVVGTTAEAVNPAMSWQFQLLALLIILGQFVSYVHPDINATNFPFSAADLDGLIERARSIVLVTIKHLDHDPETPEVLRIIDSKGLRPATLLELLVKWLINPGQWKDCLVVALGSVWRELVPYVCGYGSHRKLHLSTVAYTWDRRYTFAAVSKTISA